MCINSHVLLVLHKKEVNWHLHDASAALSTRWIGRGANFLRLTGIEPRFINHPACTWVAAQTGLSRAHACFIQSLDMSQYSKSLNTTEQLNNTKTPPVSTPRCAVPSDMLGEQLHIRAIWLYWSNKTNHVLTSYDKLWGATQVKTWDLVSNFVHYLLEVRNSTRPKHYPKVQFLSRRKQPPYPGQAIRETTAAHSADHITSTNAMCEKKNCRIFEQ